MSELNNYLEEVNAGLDPVLRTLVENAVAPRLTEAVKWSLFGGGKRFRPALVCASGEAFGVQREKLLRTSAAFEMIHTYSLIHDDLPAMDDDDLRRGRATCHVKFDEATAILAGDALQSLAFTAIADDQSIDFSVRVAIIRELSSAATKMVEGQQLDLDSEGSVSGIEQLRQIHRHKTGAMIVAAVRAGALVGGATEEELSIMTRYGDSIGLLFQITDDLLDVTGTTEQLGKTAGKDAVAEKTTYPALLGLDGSRDEARRVHTDALSALASLSRKTKVLTLLADFIMSRSS
jgi:geranylgeranyl pyrophosphate synthase